MLVDGSPADFNALDATKNASIKGENIVRAKRATFTFSPNHSGFLTFLFLFENHQNCLIYDLQVWHFPRIFVHLKLTCLVTLFDRKL